MIKAYLEKMNKSEILLVMIGGMATVAGGVLAAYIGFLGGEDEVLKLYYAKHLLTASVMVVKFAQNKQRATDLVRGVKGVKRIVNELQVTNDYGIGAAANDLWIETKLKVLLLGTKDIRSINYRWRSVNGTVYVIGAARSQQEMNTVLDVIRKTDRVKKVINHAWVRPPKAQ